MPQQPLDPNRTPQQGWNLAQFQCGRCGTTITATTEREYVNLVSGHKANCHTDPTG